MDFFNDRSPTPRRPGDHERPLDRGALLDANARIRASAPAYRQRDVNTRIRTAAVQRHRTRRAGGADFGSVGEYINFITGTEE